MDPTLEEKQNDQTQNKQSGQGIVSRGINSINSLRGANRLLSGPANKIVQRVAVQTALRGFAAFLAGPWFPVALTLGLVLLFTVIIVVGFGGVPPSETNIQAPYLSPTATQSATPTEAIITPTPAP